MAGYRSEIILTNLNGLFYIKTKRPYENTFIAYIH